MNETSDNQIFRQIKKILVTECEVDEKKIELNSHLQNELNMDSLALLTLAVAVENHYQLSLEENPENPPQNILEVVHLIQNRLKEKAS